MDDWKPRSGAAACLPFLPFACAQARRQEILSIYGVESRRGRLCTIFRLGITYQCASTTRLQARLRLVCCRGLQCLSLTQTSQHLPDDLLWAAQAWRCDPGTARDRLPHSRLSPITPPPTGHVPGQRCLAYAGDAPSWGSWPNHCWLEPRQRAGAGPLMTCWLLPPKRPCPCASRRSDHSTSACTAGVTRPHSAMDLEHSRCLRPDSSHCHPVWQVRWRSRPNQTEPIDVRTACASRKSGRRLRRWTGGTYVCPI